MSLSVYETALTAGVPLTLRFDDGRTATVDVPQWCGPLDAADERLLRRVDGPALDVGCGPGRFVAALNARGVEALGLDISGLAVELARERGGDAVQGDVFGPVPGAGRWASVLLIDGNIGIGGDPVRLLDRCRALLRPGGVVHVEVGPPGSQSGRTRVRLELESDARVGSWFWWGWLAAGEVEGLAGLAGLSVSDHWQYGGRHFVELRRDSRPRGRS